MGAPAFSGRDHSGDSAAHGQLQPQPPGSPDCSDGSVAARAAMVGPVGRRVCGDLTSDISDRSLNLIDFAVQQVASQIQLTDMSVASTHSLPRYRFVTAPGR